MVDALLTLGRGARVGIFGAPGAGKTTLLESLVDGCVADAVVVALAGERGREAQHWIARCDERTTVICATSDRPAQERVAAAHVAVAHAQALRERGLDVLLVLDSLARVAAASREIAVASGQSAGRGGYPPSVFAELARLVEVAGAVSDGSITLIATVLSDGDDRDPVSEAARSLRMGTSVFQSRSRTPGGFRPSMLSSTSRTMEMVASEAHLRDARALRHALRFSTGSKTRAAWASSPRRARHARRSPSKTTSRVFCVRAGSDAITAGIYRNSRSCRILERENGDR